MKKLNVQLFASAVVVVGVGFSLLVGPSLELSSIVLGALALVGYDSKLRQEVEGFEQRAQKQIDDALKKYETLIVEQNEKMNAVGMKMGFITKANDGRVVTNVQANQENIQSIKRRF